MWEDQSLLNWDSNDYRLFAGDLGNDVTDEVLIYCFLLLTVLTTSFSGFVSNIWSVSKLPDGKGGEGQEEQQDQRLWLCQLQVTR